MGIQFYTERVTFKDVTVGNGEVQKQVFHDFATDIKEGSATLSSFYNTYPKDGDQRYVEFVSARIENIQCEDKRVSCTVTLGLDDGGGEDEGGEVSTERAYADVLFIADCE